MPKLQCWLRQVETTVLLRVATKMVMLMDTEKGAPKDLILEGCARQQSPLAKVLVEAVAILSIFWA